MAEDEGADGFDEWQGTVILEIPLAVGSASARAKHTDPEEIAAWVRAHITSVMGQQYREADDVQVGEILKSHRDDHWTDWS
jgi:hypothetical protein